MKTIFSLLLFLSLLFNIKDTSAALYCYYSPAGPSIVSFPLPATIAITPGLAVGAVLWQSSSVRSQNRVTICNQNWYAVTAYGNDIKMANTAVGGVYATNIPGIGVQVMGYNQPLPAPGTSKSFAYYAPTGVVSYLSMQIKLIKTGPIAAGTLSFPNTLLGGAYASESATVLLNEYPYGLANVTGSTAITLPTCSTQDLTIPMGSVGVNEFSRVGHTARATRFQVALLNCPTGWRNIYYQFSSITPVLSPNGVVGLLERGGPPASGIGIQLLDAKRRPLTAATGFNAFVPLGTVEGKNYDPAKGGSFFMNFTARYYQTEAIVTAGQADSVVEFITGYD